MKLELNEYSPELEGQFASEWDKKVETLGGNVFHSFNWGVFSQYDKSGSTLIFAEQKSEADETLSLTPLYLRESSLPLVGKFRRRLTLDSLPCSATGQSRLEFIQLLQNTIGPAFMLPQTSVGSFYADSDSNFPISLVDRERLEFILSLKNENLEKDFSSRRKRIFKKSKKSGLEFKECDFETGFSTLCKLQSRSNERIASRGGPSLQAIDKSSEERYRAFHTAGVLRFLAAVKAGDLEGLILVSFFASKAYYHQAFHSDTGFELGSPTFLVANALELARSEGLNEFNLGGTGKDARQKGSAEHGLWEFKKSFGSKEIELVNLVLPSKKNWIEQLQEERR